MASTNNIILKGNYNSVVVLNKPLSANGTLVSVASITNVVREGSTAENSSISLGNSTVASGNYSVAYGKESNATGNYSIAEGISANATHDKSYVWNAANSPKSSMGIGTFSIFPTNGTEGFFIGGESLKNIIEGSTAIGAATLTGDNTFVGNNTFTTTTLVNGLNLSSTSNADFSQGNLTVSNQISGTSNSYAANTKFVTEAITSLSADLEKKIEGTISEERVIEIVEDYLKAALGNNIIKT